MQTLALISLIQMQLTSKHTLCKCQFGLFSGGNMLLLHRCDEKLHFTFDIPCGQQAGNLPNHLMNWNSCPPSPAITFYSAVAAAIIYENFLRAIHYSGQSNQRYQPPSALTPHHHCWTRREHRCRLACLATVAWVRPISNKTWPFISSLSRTSVIPSDRTPTKLVSPLWSPAASIVSTVRAAALM